MKSKWICAALFASILTVPVFGQVSVYLRAGPPPLRREVRTVAPGPGYSWVEGYWAPQGRHYAWVGGHWQQPPYEGAYWNHPHYDHYQEGWQIHEGHWDHEDHDRHDDGH